MTARRFGERVLTVGLAAGLAVLMMGAGRRMPDPIAGKGGGPKGKSGSLDASFAGDGTLMTFIPPILEEPRYNTDVATAVAIDSRGGILVAGLETTGRSVLERFNADGTLDTTFGTDGLATFPQPGNGHETFLAVQPDGRILMGGGSLAMARFMPDGSLDPGFGQGGIAQLPVYGSEIALLPDGRIVLASSVHLARYESNGLPDNTFGTNGVVKTGLISTSNALDMARQADGRFVLVFVYGFTTRVVRFEEDGSPDTGFGSGGGLTLPFIWPFVVVQSDGQILVGGTSFRELPGYVTELEFLDFQIARLHPDGNIDESYGGEGLGLVTTHFQGRSSSLRALALDAQGRLLAAGRAFKNSGAGDFALARYLPDGSLDLSFGRSGRTTADMDRNRYDETVLAIAVQPDGRPVVAGFVAIDRPGLLDADAWGLARFLP